MEGHNVLSGYVMIPGWLLAKQPDANDLLVYATLASFGRFNTLAGCYEECRPALSTIAEQAGLSVSSVKRGIGNLLRFGAVERQQRYADDRKTQLPSVYRVIFGALVGPQEQGGFTGEQGGESTGEQGGGSPVDREQEPPTQNQDTKKPSTSSRGTRVPEDFKPTDEMIEWARLNAPGIGWSEHEKFMDYWRGVSGQRGVKQDWCATWRNWMRKAADDHGARPVSGPPRQQHKSFRQRDAEAADAETARMRVAQDLIDQGMQPRAAYSRAKAMETNAGLPYIDGEFSETTAREVTSNEAGSGERAAPHDRGA